MIQTTIAAPAAPTSDNAVSSTVFPVISNTTGTPDRVQHQSKAVVSSTTSRKIGKITYLVESSSSSTATETLNQKIEQMILRECSRVMK